MPKRGERLPWRVRGVWDNGITWTETKHSQDAAMRTVEMASRIVGPKGERQAVTVSHRDGLVPDVVLQPAELPEE